MTLRNYARKVERTRALQANYFATRAQQSLIEARVAEKDLDEDTRQILRLTAPEGPAPKTPLELVHWIASRPDPVAALQRVITLASAWNLGPVIAAWDTADIVSLHRQLQLRRSHVTTIQKG